MQNTGQILKEPKGLQPPLEGGRRGPNLCQQPRLSTGEVEQALSLRSGLLRKAEMDFSEQWTGIWLILCLLHLPFFSGSSWGWDFQLFLSFKKENRFATQ